MKALPGAFPDQVSLLTRVAQIHFQCVPIFTFEERECEPLGKNEKMRFIAYLSLNQFEVGKGYGANKRIAKMTASTMAL